MKKQKVEINFKSWDQFENETSEAAKYKVCTDPKCKVDKKAAEDFVYSGLDTGLGNTSGECPTCNGRGFVRR